MENILTTHQVKEIPVVAVIGGGSFATAIVKMLSENEVKIRWALRSKSDINHIKKYQNNPSYLSSVHIKLDKVSPTSNVHEAVTGSDYIVIAIPSAFVPDALKDLTSEDFRGKKVVSAVKGLISEQNETVTAYIARKYEVPQKRLFVIAGPCHAEEVAFERQSYLTIAGKKLTKADKFAKMLSSRYVKVSPNDDLQGVQLCAAIKNIIAIACGISNGLGYGDNFNAVLVANALQETKRFLDKVCPHSNRDLNSSAYLGDLLVTAYSQFSRNRTLGNMVGKGYSVKSAQVEMNMIAEGYYAVNAIYQKNKQYQVEMPVVRSVYNILYERISPIIEMRILKGNLK